MLADVKARLTEAITALGRLTGKVDAILTTFEPEGTATAEELEERLEAARGRLGVFARGSPRTCPSTPWDL